MPAARAHPNSSRRLLIVLAAVSCGLYAALAIAGDLRGRLPAYLAVHAILFILYLAASWIVLSDPARGRAGGIVLAGAVVMRIVFLPAEPALSDDIWRYLWEGNLHWLGINPYQHAPGAEHLAALRDGVYERINHKDLPAIYPPVTQWALALGALAWPAPWAMKGVFIAADIALVVVLMRLLRLTGRPECRALLYAWNPLAVIEVAGSGHNEPLALLLLVVATAGIIKEKSAVSMTALTLSALSKLYPWALFPFFVRRARGAALALPPLIAAVAYLPYAGAGLGMLRSTVVYAESWRWNDSLFGILVAAVRASGISPQAKAWADERGLGTLYTEPHMLARVAVVVILAAVMIWLLRMQARGMGVPRAVFLFTAAALLLSPTLHPWYLLWILPWISLYPSPAWIALSGLAPLSYLGAPWTVWAQQVPFYLLLIGAELARRRRAGA